MIEAHLPRIIELVDSFRKIRVIPPKSGNDDNKDPGVTHFRNAQ